MCHKSHKQLHIKSQLSNLHHLAKLNKTKIILIRNNTIYAKTEKLDQKVRTQVKQFSIATRQIKLLK